MMSENKQATREEILTQTLERVRDWLDETDPDRRGGMAYVDRALAYPPTNEFQRVTEVLVRDKATLIRREQELADARRRVFELERRVFELERRVFELEQALIQIADPEVFDLDARAMRAHAQRAVHWVGEEGG